jgi:hypothetical protein
MAAWVVICSCGWIRETSPEWKANSLSKQHQRIGRAGVEHVTYIEPRDDSAGWPR